MNRLLRTIAFVLFFVGLAAPQTAVVARNVNLRPDPSTNGTPLAKLTSQTQLLLLETSPNNGFLHVNVNDQSGWVWSKNVRIQQSPSTGIGTGATTPEGAPATAISSEWDKPVPQTGSFQSDEGTCGETGDGGDTDTNRRKNRSDALASYHLVTWGAINSLDYAKNAPRSRMDWSADQLATITPVEGAAITVEGVLYKVKVKSSSPNARSGGESTNCHARLANDVDWHMPLTANVDEGENVAIIVETTPRVRKEHSQWTTSRLKPWTAHIGNTPNVNYNRQKVGISDILGCKPPYVAPDPLTKNQHEPLRGLWWIAELWPKVASREADPGVWKKYLRVNLGHRRWIAPNPVVHASVDQRLADKSLGYSPSNLPAQHLVSDCNAKENEIGSSR